MDKKCKNCNQDFEVTARDQQFYEKIEVPYPTFCPHCRMQRRMSFRNERTLYKRKCDLCKKNMVSMYRADAEAPIYCPDCWWGDEWDPASFGQELDLNKPFFPQFHELMKKVPRGSLGIVSSTNVNSDYCNYVYDVKNCYLCFGSIHCEDCLYGNPYESRDCVDSFLVREGELCYECIDCEKCYSCDFCQACTGCNDCWFCYECDGCSDCIACTGLRHKKYHIANKGFSKEEYKKFKEGLKLNTHEGIQKAADFLEKEKLKFPHRAARIINSEDCTGNFIVSSKNIHHSFDVKKCWDCAYCAQVIDFKDTYDSNYCEHAELLYEHIGHAYNYNVKFSLISGNCKNCDYTDFCVHSHDLFGCISMKRNEFCILNKQYSKEEYFEMVEKLKARMTERGEYGEFFPAEISPFRYKETVAMDYFPGNKGFLSFPI